MGGWARLPVTTELLRQVLNLPEGTEITNADAVGFGRIEFIVTHPDIPAKAPKEGEKLQIVMPKFRKQEPIVFEGWNPS